MPKMPKVCTGTRECTWECEIMKNRIISFLTLGFHNKTSYYDNNLGNIGISHFIVLCRYCIFYKSKVCGNLALSKMYPLSCLYITFWQFSRYLNFFCIIIFVRMSCDQLPLMLLLLLFWGTNNHTHKYGKLNL
uniref:Uncharacterized protein n=1 Tax=Myotis myotis TaxID=51298 RepID=A0A7J7VZ47_MYOMY|nr:hypothetical protein mMyoMyo1_012323 [Myotis myotis]